MTAWHHVKATTIFYKLKNSLGIKLKKKQNKSWARVVSPSATLVKQSQWRRKQPLNTVMSRLNNQLTCEPLSNAEFCKAQLICCRNERLANREFTTGSAATSLVCICERFVRVCVVCMSGAWGAAKWKTNKQLESDTDSLRTCWGSSRVLHQSDFLVSAETAGFCESESKFWGKKCFYP